MATSGKFWKKMRDMLYVSVGGAAFFAGISVYNNDCKFYRHVTLPLLRCVDPETSHHLTVWALKHKIVPARRDKPPAELHVRCLGFELNSPIGLAAGLDKDGEAVEGLSRLGFGLVEVGSVTPRPQAGNPQPRVFRLVEDEAIINRYGFNSAGHAAVKINLSALQPPGSRLVPVGVNLGMNKGSVDSTEDYRKGVRELGPLADYLVINVSSPNTPGLRGLQEGGALSELLDGVLQERNKLAGKFTPPLLVKLAPDLSDEEIKNICKLLLNKKVDGVIVSNTTLRRPSTLRSEHRGEIGGLSGAPLEDHATRVVALVADCTGGALPIVGCGGVRDGAGVYRKLRAGASLVQLYTGLVYAGPGLVKEAEQDLLTLLRKDGYSSVSEIIGKDIKDILNNS